jgi:hypothetical protein
MQPKYRKEDSYKMTSQKLAKVALIAITLCIASAQMPQAMAKKVTKTKTVVTKPVLKQLI